MPKNSTAKASRREGIPDFVIKPRAADYYKVLGIAPSATAAQIREHYYALARVQHPDVGGDAVAMAAITEAYGVLGNATRRKAYDSKRRFLSKPCTACKGQGVTYRTIGFTKRQAQPCRTCGGTGLQGGTNEKA